MADPARPQFGLLRMGLLYRERPSAYGIAPRGEEMALVEVTLPGQAAFFDLPGGGVDEGEAETDGLIREFGEETGLIVRPGPLITRADQYMVSVHQELFNSQGAFYEVAVEGMDESLKSEPTHVLVWVSPHEALRRLRHDSHAWAVATWLRRR